MSSKPRILVVGSINMDLVVRTPHMPAPGETVLGGGFVTSPGGKGANQAVAIARLGGDCRFIGRVGQDAFGQQLLAGMQAEHIDCTHVMPTPDASTGVAIIVVDSHGENAIVVASGANHLVSPDDVFSAGSAFEQAQVVVLQLELPLPTVRAAIQLARRHGCKIILDPAPAQANLPTELCEVDVISPNVTEAELITGHRSVDETTDKLVATELIGRGAAAAVLKLGSRGSMVVTADGHFYTVWPYKVSVVDTTAAGDAFTGALSVALGQGKHMRQAAQFANAAGALACSSMGAQSAMPNLDQVNLLMRDQPMPG